MTVDVAPPPVAPQPPATLPGYAEERVHTALFWLAIVAVVLGALFIGASRVRSSQAPKLVTFPLFDQTAVMSGTLTYHVDPDTLVPLQTPTDISFHDVRRVQTPGQLDFQDVVVSTDAVTLDGSRHTTLTSQYLVDIRTLKNLGSANAWSFAGGNTADRSAAYSVNLPLDSGSGPFQIWLNEADRAYTFTQVGQPFVENGVTVMRLRGHLDGAPVDAQFMTQLARARVPAGMTLRQLRSAVEALGVHVDGAFPAMPATLSNSEVATVLDHIPLDYTMSADTSLLVEPRTGTIVSVENMAEAFSGHLDAARLRALTALFDNHRSSAGMQTGAAAVAKLAAVPDAPVFDLHYAQTPASVRTLSGYAANQRDWINRMTRVIPTTLFAVGIGLIALGALCGAVAWRRRNVVGAYWWEEE